MTGWTRRAMRLFQFADDSTASRDITSFMAQVRGMEVQADPLAHIGPVEDAVDIDYAGRRGRTPLGRWRGYRWSSKTCGRTSPGATPCSVVKTLPSSC